MIGESEFYPDLDGVADGPCIFSAILNKPIAFFFDEGIRAVRSASASLALE